MEFSAKSSFSHRLGCIFNKTMLCVFHNNEKVFKKLLYVNDT